MATIREIFKEVISEIKPVGGADIKDIPLVSDLGLKVVTVIATKYAADRIESILDTKTQIVTNLGKIQEQTNIDTHNGDIVL